jgi:hypothetical protein
LNGAGQLLDGYTRMLLLTRIHDRLRAKLSQGPTHSDELRCGQGEIDLSTAEFGFYSELALRVRVVVQNEIAHNPDREVGQRGDFQTAIPQLLSADHFVSTLLVANGAARRAGHCDTWLSYPGMFVQALVRSDKN